MTFSQGPVSNAMRVATLVSVKRIFIAWPALMDIIPINLMYKETFLSALLVELTFVRSKLSDL